MFPYLNTHVTWYWSLSQGWRWGHHFITGTHLRSHLQPASDPQTRCQEQIIEQKSRCDSARRGVRHHTFLGTLAARITWHGGTLCHDIQSALSFSGRHLCTDARGKDGGEDGLLWIKAVPPPCYQRMILMKAQSVKFGLMYDFHFDISLIYCP